MELRHLRCFLAVAKELHFGHAAEKLHMDQSPLSRSIKELERHLGTALFLRTTRNTRLTAAGKIFLECVPRIFDAIEQARVNVKAATAGYQGLLRISLSDGVTVAKLSELMALSRQEDPDIAIHFFEVPLSQQILGLQEGLYDAGFAQSKEVGQCLLAVPVWSEELHVAIPAGHPILDFKCIPLVELSRYPLVILDPQLYEGYGRQVERFLRGKGKPQPSFSCVRSFDLMMAMVSAGYALGVAGASNIAATPEKNVLSRPLEQSTMLDTWLLRPDAEPSASLTRFVERVVRIGSWYYNP